MPDDPPPSDPPPRQLPHCEERVRLLRAHSDRAGVYADCVRQMADSAISGQEEHVWEVRRKCRAAWEETERSRMALYRHEADHRCDRGAQAPSACEQ